MPPDTTTHGLQAFYRGLITLKNDRTTYIRSSDVLANYEQLGHLLRSHQELYGSSTTTTSSSSSSGGGGSSSSSNGRQTEPSSKSLSQLECESLLASGWDVC